MDHRPYHHSILLRDVKTTYTMFVWLEEMCGTGVGAHVSSFDFSLDELGERTWAYALSPILKSDDFLVRLDVWFVNLDDAAMFKLMYGE